VKNIHIVKSLQSLQTVESHSPNNAFLNVLLVHFVTIDHLKDIPTLEALGNDAEGVGELVEEGILVGEDVWTLYTGQNANFVQAVSQLFLREISNPHLFQGVLLPILLSFHSVYCRKGPLPQLAHHRVLIH
jgi:hypothetical protein